MISIMRTLKIVLFAGMLTTAVPAQPVVSAVLNSASYSALVSPGCLIAIFGSKLGPSAMSAQTVPLPPTLGGVSVTVGGAAAPLLFVSPNQINALIPADLAIPENTVVPIVVTAPDGRTTYNIRLNRDAPAIFTQDGSGTGRAFVLDPAFNAVGTVAPRDVVILYATGLGPTDSSGKVLDAVEVDIGERPAQILFAGLAPGLPGVYQLNVIAPVPATDRLYIRSGGWQSNIAQIGIRSGANATNVSGTIDGLFPSSDPGFPKVPMPCSGPDDPGPCGPMGESFSVLLNAGTFSVSFDIAASATTFDVAAVGDGGATIITIDPAGTYLGSVSTVTSAARAGDFSSSIQRLWDYTSCDFMSAVCLRFQNFVPPSRMTPFSVRAAQMLPLPNTPASASPNATFQASGKLSGTHFIVDDQNNSALSKFGGFVQVPYGPFPSRTATFKLYVDAKLIASQDLVYLLWYRGLAHFLDF